jgi:hypothetical protein
MILAAELRLPLAGKGRTMEVRLTLNALAAAISFAFLAAVVFGMV